MAKDLFALFIIVFWIAFGVGAMLFNFGDFPQFQTDSLENSNSVTILINFITVFFSSMFFYVPSIPIYFTFILNILQLFSALTIYILLRG